MHNLYFILLSYIISLQILANTVSTIKIDGTLQMINGEVIAACVTQRGRLEAQAYNDISLLALDHQKVASMVEKTLKSNLSFTELEVYYYYYDSITLQQCIIGEYYCNSVQMKILIKFQNKKYEDEIRYEPFEI